MNDLSNDEVVLRQAQIAGAVAEIDLQQIEVSRHLTPAHDKWLQG